MYCLFGYIGGGAKVTSFFIRIPFIRIARLTIPKIKNMLRIHAFFYKKHNYKKHRAILLKILRNI